MSSLLRYFPVKSAHWLLNVLLLAIPAAAWLHHGGAPPLWTFAAAAVAIIPLAGILGEATDQLSAYTGAVIGGIANATLGNATELIISIFALRAGHIEVVKASLSGSIIGNLLLVLGASLFVGGIGRKRQKFNRAAMGVNTSMMFIAVIALIVPAVFDISVYGDIAQRGPEVYRLSLWTSAVLIALYGASLLFMLKTNRNLFAGEDEHRHEKQMPRNPRWFVITSLATTTALIAWISEILVDSIAPATKAMSMTEFFVGIVIVAIIGNAAEHSTAIKFAREDKLDLTMGIAVGSSAQIALFVAPVLVLVSWLFHQHMSLVFNGFEIAAVVLSIIVVEMISSDGETNWFEGAQLLAAYIIMAVAFYFVPA